MLCEQLRSVIVNKNNKKHPYRAMLPPKGEDTEQWLLSTTENFHEANIDLLMSADESPPTNIEKFRHLGTNEFTCLLTMAQVPLEDGTFSPPFLFCMALPMVPHIRVSTNLGTAF
jgi:hypothetical protein